MKIIPYKTAPIIEIFFLVSLRYYSTGLARAVRLLWFWSDQFSQGKIKFHCYKKQVRNRSASVIFGLVRLTRKNTSRNAGLSAMHTFKFIAKHILLCKNLSNKQSGSVIFRPARLITLYYN